MDEKITAAAAAPTDEAEPVFVAASEVHERACAGQYPPSRPIDPRDGIGDIPRPSADHSRKSRPARACDESPLQVTR